MFVARCQEVNAGRGLRFAIHLNSRPATFADVLEGLRLDEAFRLYFNDLLAASPFSAFRWETPPVTTSTAAQEFEFVLLNSPGLARHPDAEAFAEHFVDDTNRGIAIVPNLGGDAILIIPRAIAADSCYGHLASFVREAPRWQQQALWQAVAETMKRRVGRRPVWLSTAGAGVSWLHVRLDDQPKYYGFDPYRRAAIHPDG